MHDASVAPAALEARRGPPEALAQALQAARADTLRLFAAFERHLPGLQVPQRAELNPPLWELGHIGWFQAHWIERFPARQRALGALADPADHPGSPDDVFYDSSRVPHAARWQLPLPDAERTRAQLAQQLQTTLALLNEAGDGDDALYVFRLALLHEDMHHEAGLYMARSLGVPVDDARWLPQPLPAPAAPLSLQGGVWQLGSPDDAGFVFDNERQAHAVTLQPYAIDRQAVRWAEFLPFVEAGGYAQPQWWTEAGARWLGEQAAAAFEGQPAPRYLRREAEGWRQWHQGHWHPLNLHEAACHLSLHEAQAWCRWAGRRLPTEAEWECAACSAPQAFRWGDVWEWTASPFRPFEGFQPHPYRDYSAPWFDGRPVLRGASHCTQPRMRHPRYRNFFAAGRTDVPAGFRSCAL
jgi:iron(II)-dependent oxidoreductase